MDREGEATGHTMTSPGVTHKGSEWRAGDMERSGSPEH